MKKRDFLISTAAASTIPLFGRVAWTKQTPAPPKAEIVTLAKDLQGYYADRLKAAVSFYGGGIADPNDTLGRKSLLDLIPQLQAPILLIYGAKDASIKSSEPEKIAKALYDANKNYTIKVIANAGHGFASYDRDSYVEEAAQQAWKTTLAFFGEHLNGLKN